MGRKSSPLSTRAEQILSAINEKVRLQTAYDKWRANPHGHASALLRQIGAAHERYVELFTPEERRAHAVDDWMAKHGKAEP